MKRCDFCDRPAVVWDDKANLCAVHFTVVNRSLTTQEWNATVDIMDMRLQERQAEALEAIAKALTKEGS